MGLAPLNLKGWIEEHKDLLKPPTGAATIWQDTEFIVTIVGGPNARTDYHDDPAEEFFYQLKGDMHLRIIEDGKPRDLPIKEGEVLLLPPHVRHSPQRPAGSVGLIFERVRRPGEIDAFEWYCEKCDHLLARNEADVELLERDLPPLFEAYYNDPDAQICKNCGHKNPGRPES